MIRWQRILLVIAVPALIHGVPEATALQKSSRLSRPKKTVVRQSSQHLPFPSTRRFFRSPLSSATATITRTEEQQEQHKKQYQQAIQNVRERAKSGGSRHVPFEDSLALDPTGGLVWSATCIGFIGLVFGLTKSGRLSPFFRCATSFLKNAFFAYRGALSARPLGTKVATGATLAILGDALAQSTTSTSTGAPYDKRRAASFAAFDSCYRVFQHFMFPAVIGLCGGDVVRHLLPPAFGPVAAAVERTLLYQLVIVPSVYYPVFFAFTGSIQGLSPKESLARARLQFFRCWRRNLMFWIPTQMVLFGVVSEDWQIPFACVMGVMWSAILSLTAGKTTAASSTSTKQ